MSHLYSTNCTERFQVSYTSAMTLKIVIHFRFQRTYSKCFEAHEILHITISIELVSYLRWCQNQIPKSIYAMVSILDTYKFITNLIVSHIYNIWWVLFCSKNSLSRIVLSLWDTAYLMAPFIYFDAVFECRIYMKCCYIRTKNVFCTALIAQFGFLNSVQFYECHTFMMST